MSRPRVLVTRGTGLPGRHAVDALGWGERVHGRLPEVRCPARFAGRPNPSPRDNRADRDAAA